MTFSKQFELGDKVWYETANGGRYLMVIKDICDDSTVDLYPHNATSSLLEDAGAKFRYIYKSDLTPATAVTEVNLMKAKKVAEIALKQAEKITEAKGQAMTHAQKKFVSEAIIQGFLEMKQQFAVLEKSGLLDNLN